MSGEMKASEAEIVKIIARAIERYVYNPQRAPIIAEFVLDALDEAGLSITAALRARAPAPGSSAP